MGRIDLICWMLVVVFFCGSSLLFAGDLNNAFIASGGVVLVMILIGLSIEVIIESLRNIKGLGTIAGFITNGPELICLVVGLSVGDVLFAASTPLGSNLMNPILLIAAALTVKALPELAKTSLKYSLACILTTISLAVSFYLIPLNYHICWIVTAVVLSTILFVRRPDEPSETAVEKEMFARWNIIPAVGVLITAGYFLDPVVSFASLQSNAPKGVIGFFVLATLSSWPEFRCCLALFNRKRYLSAILNITVSNITNIWLTIAGLITYFSEVKRSQKISAEHYPSFNPLYFIE